MNRQKSFDRFAKRVSRPSPVRAPTKTRASSAQIGKDKAIISREDLEAGRVNFLDIRDPRARIIGPVHPGGILRGEFLDPLAITPYRLAKSLNVPLTRVAAIIAGKRSITADTALRLGRFFDMSPEFWLNLQEQYDLNQARVELGDRLADEVTPFDLPAVA